MSFRFCICAADPSITDTSAFCREETYPLLAPLDCIKRSIGCLDAQERNHTVHRDQVEDITLSRFFTSAQPLLYRQERRSLAISPDPPRT